MSSDYFTPQVADFDPLYQWSTLTAAGGGGEPSGSAHRYATIGGKSVDVYEQVGFLLGCLRQTSGARTLPQRPWMYRVRYPEDDPVADRSRRTDSGPPTRWWGGRDGQPQREGVL